MIFIMIVYICIFIIIYQRWIWVILTCRFINFLCNFIFHKLQNIIIIILQNDANDISDSHARNKNFFLRCIVNLYCRRHRKSIWKQHPTVSTNTLLLCDALNLWLCAICWPNNFHKSKMKSTVCWFLSWHFSTDGVPFSFPLQYHNKWFNVNKMMPSLFSDGC